MLEEWGGSILSPCTPKQFRKRAYPAGTLFFYSEQGEAETDCGYEGRLGAGCGAPFLFGMGRIDLGPWLWKEP